jgi:hypothetical protein
LCSVLYPDFAHNFTCSLFNAERTTSANRFPISDDATQEECTVRQIAPILMKTRLIQPQPTNLSKFVLISDDGPVTIVRLKEEIERRADLQVQPLASRNLLK